MGWLEKELTLVKREINNFAKARKAALNVLNEYEKEYQSKNPVDLKKIYPFSKKLLQVIS